MSNKENKEVLKNLKTEVASELGIDLSKAKLTAREAGSVGGQMVKRMIEKAEKEIK